MIDSNDGKFLQVWISEGCGQSAASVPVEFTVSKPNVLCLQNNYILLSRLWSEILLQWGKSRNRRESSSRSSEHRARFQSHSKIAEHGSKNRGTCLTDSLYQRLSSRSWDNNIESAAALKVRKRPRSEGQNRLHLLPSGNVIRHSF